MTVRAITIAQKLDAPSDTVMLDAQARHIRRKLLTTEKGESILVDLEKAVHLKDGDCLVLEDGRAILVRAAEEDVLEVRGIDALHLARLAWHIGNRHLEAQIEPARILIRPDHVIAKMLEQQGATVTLVTEPFSPEPGAYSHSHAAEPTGTYSYAP